jgi:hypothetical protein
MLMLVVMSMGIMTVRAVNQRRRIRKRCQKPMSKGGFVGVPVINGQLMPSVARFLTHWDRIQLRDAMTWYARKSPYDDDGWLAGTVRITIETTTRGSIQTVLDIPLDDGEIPDGLEIEWTDYYTKYGVDEDEVLNFKDVWPRRSYFDEVYLIQEKPKAITPAQVISVAVEVIKDF